MAGILVQKGDGSYEPFDARKVKLALRKSGAGGQLSEDVLELVQQKLYPKITTREIYRLAFSELKNMRPGAAARFGLKSALFKLGPEGYPFETFVGSLLKGRGYSTQLRQKLRGKCVSHEVDVVARRSAQGGSPAYSSVVECKFHNASGIRCHIQSALYTWARFLDIRDANSGDINSAWLATNTKFSSDVVQYSDCVGLKLLGWNFPLDESIQVRIEENKLYPITILGSLDRRTFVSLHNSGIILVPELLSAPHETLSQLRLPHKKLSSLLDEAKSAMSSKS